MGKRKADIFMVIESVNNWFDASTHDPIALKRSADQGNQSVIREEIAIQSKRTEAADANPRLIGLTVSVSNVDPAAEVAQPGGLKFGEGVTDPLYAEVDNTARTAHEAFWRLLQTIGYECS